MLGSLRSDSRRATDTTAGRSREPTGDWRFLCAANVLTPRPRSGHGQIEHPAVLADQNPLNA
jgi:hypothetical protein